MKNYFIILFFIFFSPNYCFSQIVLGFTNLDASYDQTNDDGLSINRYYVSQIDGVQQAPAGASLQLVPCTCRQHKINETIISLIIISPLQYINQVF